MASAYIKGNFTLAAATAVQLSTRLVAELYTGPMLGKYLKIHPKALTDVFVGDASTVDATTGIPVVTTDLFIRTGTKDACVDAGRYWLFSTGGGDISVHFESL